MNIQVGDYVACLTQSEFNKVAHQIVKLKNLVRLKMNAKDFINVWGLDKAKRNLK